MCMYWVRLVVCIFALNVGGPCLVRGAETRAPSSIFSFLSSFSHFYLILHIKHIIRIISRTQTPKFNKKLPTPNQGHTNQEHNCRKKQSPGHLLYCIQSPRLVAPSFGEDKQTIEHTERVFPQFYQSSRNICQRTQRKKKRKQVMDD